MSSNETSRPPKDAIREVEGGQSIHRAFRVMRELAAATSHETKVSAIAKNLGMNQTTVHRILRVLVAEGFARQTRESRNYQIGSELFRIADTAKEKDIRYHLQPLINAAADKFEDSIFLWVISGSEVICIDFCIGSYPIRVVPFHAGSRRPIGVGGAGITALAAQNPKKAKATLQRLEPTLKDFGVTLTQVWQLQESCREDGFSYQPGLFIKDIASISVPIKDSSGKMIAILNLVAMKDRLEKPSRRKEIVDFVKKSITD